MQSYVASPRGTALPSLCLSLGFPRLCIHQWVGQHWAGRGGALQALRGAGDTSGAPGVFTWPWMPLRWAEQSELGASGQHPQGTRITRSSVMIQSPGCPTCCPQVSGSEYKEGTKAAGKVADSRSPELTGATCATPGVSRTPTRPGCAPHLIRPLGSRCFCLSLLLPRVCPLQCPAAAPCAQAAAGFSHNDC